MPRWTYPDPIASPVERRPTATLVPGAAVRGNDNLGLSAPGDVFELGAKDHLVGPRTRPSRAVYCDVRVDVGVRPNENDQKRPADAAIGRVVAGLRCSVGTKGLRLPRPWCSRGEGAVGVAGNRSARARIAAVASASMLSPVRGVTGAGHAEIRLRLARHEELARELLVDVGPDVGRT